MIPPPLFLYPGFHSPLSLLLLQWHRLETVLQFPLLTDHLIVPQTSKWNVETFLTLPLPTPTRQHNHGSMNLMTSINTIHLHCHSTNESEQFEQFHCQSLQLYIPPLQLWLAVNHQVHIFFSESPKRASNNKSPTCARALESGINSWPKHKLNYLTNT